MERVHLSGNVLNLALRNPAVLARPAATLGLLSGGRLELGLAASRSDEQGSHDGCPVPSSDRSNDYRTWKRVRPASTPATGVGTV